MGELRQQAAEAPRVPELQRPTSSGGGRGRPGPRHFVPAERTVSHASGKDARARELAVDKRLSAARVLQWFMEARAQSFSFAKLASFPVPFQITALVLRRA